MCKSSLYRDQRGKSFPLLLRFSELIPEHICTCQHARRHADKHCMQTVHIQTCHSPAYPRAPVCHSCHSNAFEKHRTDYYLLLPLIMSLTM